MHFRTFSANLPFSVNLILLLLNLLLFIKYCLNVIKQSHPEGVGKPTEGLRMHFGCAIYEFECVITVYPEGNEEQNRAGSCVKVCFPVHQLQLAVHILV